MLGDEPQLAVFTTVGVVRKRKPIVRVSHDPEGDWQFFAADDTDESKNAMLISAREILAIDPSLREIASMPPDHVATRTHVEGEWTIEPHEPEDKDTD